MWVVRIFTRGDENMQARTIMTIVMSILFLSTIAFAESATDFLKAKHEEMKVIVKENKPDDAIREDLRLKMDTFFDYDTLGKKTIEADWDKQKTEDQKRFIELFKKMIQKSYLKKFKPRTDYTIEFTKEESKEGVIIVYATIVYKDSEADVEYWMHKKDKGFFVWDVVVDESSLMRTYRKKFDKVIQKDGFAKLLEKMDKTVQKGDENEDKDEDEGTEKDDKEG